MSFHKGMGGYAAANNGTPLNIYDWNGNFTVDLHETTHSGSQGWKNRVPCNQDSSGTLSVPWDSTNTPDVMGFGRGASIALKLELGDSGLAYTVSSALVKDHKFKVSSHASAIVELTIDWEGNGPVTGPA